MDFNMDFNIKMKPHPKNGLEVRDSTSCYIQSPKIKKKHSSFADVLHPSGVLSSTNIPTLPPPQLVGRELPSRKSPYPGHQWPVGESEMILAVTQSQVTPS